ncbi:MAG: hypothetical protein WC647_09455 [Desulfomonilaceae bacterium]|jgi:hypothetical protein
MKNVLRSLSFVFSAGCFGGLVNSLEVFLVGHFGVTEAMGVKMAPEFMPMWLYPRIVWGGVWGFTFLIPAWRNKPWIRILIFSLGPTIGQLFVVFPYKLAKGWLGLDLGLFTPVFVIFSNLIWALFAELWLKLVSDKW